VNVVRGDDSLVDVLLSLELVEPEFSTRQIPLTPLRGAVCLILAVREQAIEDKKLFEWEEYWVDSMEWRRVWDLLLEAKQKIDSTAPVSYYESVDV